MDNGNTKKLDEKKIKEVMNKDTVELDYDLKNNMNTYYKRNSDKLTVDNNHQDDDLDEQLEKSIEKLVQEETNVAKALLYSEDKLEGKKSYDNTKKSSMYGEKNKYIDAQNTNKSQSELKQNKTNRKHWNLILPIIAICIVVIVLVIVLLNKNNNTYDYNYAKGFECEQNSNYDKALKYYDKAINTNQGKNNVELLTAMYRCYKEQNNVEESVKMLKLIISCEPKNEQAIKDLGDFYYSQKDGMAINQLIKQCKDERCDNCLKEYQPDKPETSQESGDYYDTVIVELNSVENNHIYYTTDGTDPSESSRSYMDAINLEKGKATLKAIAVNDIGVYSDIAEWNYNIEYKQPDTPEVSLESGTYSANQEIEITHISDGCTVYYTLDGSIPLASSKEYDGSITIPEGNIIFSAIAIDKHGLSSSVIRKNYIIEPEKTYTFEESKEILKNRMVQLGVLKQNSETTVDGGAVSFVYQSKVTISEIDIYYIRVDIKKNGHTSTEGYYGVGIKNGVCYKVVNDSGEYSMEEY